MEEMELVISLLKGEELVLVVMMTIEEVAVVVIEVTMTMVTGQNMVVQIVHLAHRVVDLKILVDQEVQLVEMLVEVAKVVVELVVVPLHRVEVLVEAALDMKCHTMTMTTMMNMDMKTEMAIEKILGIEIETVIDLIEQIAGSMTDGVVIQWTDHGEIETETETGTVALIEIEIVVEAEMAGIGKIGTLETGMIAMRKDLTVIVQAVTVERVSGIEMVGERLEKTELVKGG